MSKPGTTSRRKSKRQIEEALDRKDKRDTAAWLSRQIANSDGYRCVLSGAILTAGRSSASVAHAVEELSWLVGAFTAAAWDAPARQIDEAAVMSLVEQLRDDASLLHGVAGRMQLRGAALATLKRLYAFSDKDDKGVAAEQRELLRNLERLFQRAAYVTRLADHGSDGRERWHPAPA